MHQERTLFCQIQQTLFYLILFIILFCQIQRTLFCQIFVWVGNFLGRSYCLQVANMLMFPLTASLPINP